MILGDNFNLLYSLDNIALFEKNEELFVTLENITYRLTSHPFEPCLYIDKDEKIVKIIHNSFTISEIISAAKDKMIIHAITSTQYDIKMICDFIAFAINSPIYEMDISYVEKNMDLGHMKELIDDPFYEEYKKYEDCVIDYCIVKSDYEYCGKESHKEAVIFAMKEWQESFKKEYDMDIHFDPNAMKANKIETKDFFEIPAKENEKNTYWYLFLNPPHGRSYSVDAFYQINSLLFPNGIDNLEIFDWSTDWSNYFEEGLEWWGARCTSIYDKSLKRFVVIGASATD